MDEEEEAGGDDCKEGGEGGEGEKDEGGGGDRGDDEEELTRALSADCREPPFSCVACETEDDSEEEEEEVEKGDEEESIANFEAEGEARAAPEFPPAAREILPDSLGCCPVAVFPEEGEAAA
eukprot:645191-Hanusia_phi.AAC.2